MKGWRWKDGTIFSELTDPAKLFLLRSLSSWEEISRDFECCHTWPADVSGEESRDDEDDFKFSDGGERGRKGEDLGDSFPWATGEAFVLLRRDPRFDATRFDWAESGELNIGRGVEENVERGRTWRSSCDLEGGWKETIFPTRKQAMEAWSSLPGKRR